MKSNFEKSLLFENDQLVVDLEYADLVIRFLTEGVGIPAVTWLDDDKRLGLALLRLCEVNKSAEQIEKKYSDEIRGLREQLARFNGKDAQDTFQPIDAVLFDLRRRIADRYFGWTVPNGKSRGGGIISSTPGTQGGPVAALEEPKVADGSENRTKVLQEVGYGGTPEDAAGDQVRVGVVDTKLYSGSPAATLQSPFAGHGTFVRGLIQALAPAARIEVNPALDGQAEAKAWDVAKAIASFAGQVDILNLSFACRTLDGRPPLIIERAIEALGPGVLVIAAAGNHGADPDYSRAPMWPAALPGVVAVGALDSTDLPASFSPNTAWITCLARGERLLSDYPKALVNLHAETDTTFSEPTVATRFNGSARWSGTSFSAAVVSGAVAAATVPGTKDARLAFEELLGVGTVIRPYDHGKLEIR